MQPVDKINDEINDDGFLRFGIAFLVTILYATTKFTLPVFPSVGTLNI